MSANDGGGSGSSGVALPFVDFLLLTLVTVLAIQHGTIRVHALEFEVPPVTGAGVEHIVDVTEIVLDVPSDGILERDGRAADLDAVLRELEATPSRVRVRVSIETHTVSVLELLSHLRPVAESVQVEVTPTRGG